MTSIPTPDRVWLTIKGESTDSLAVCGWSLDGPKDHAKTEYMRAQGAEWQITETMIEAGTDALKGEISFQGGPKFTLQRAQAEAVIHAALAAAPPFTGTADEMMVERVAKAICAADGHEPGPHAMPQGTSSSVCPRWMNYIPHVHAAIAAMPFTGTEGWREIESAPKDGTDLVLLCDWETPPVRVVGYWGKAKRTHEPNQDVSHPELETWRVTWDDCEFNDGFEATHWRPLPAPPKEAPK